MYLLIYKHVLDSKLCYVGTLNITWKMSTFSVNDSFFPKTSKMPLKCYNFFWKGYLFMYLFLVPGIALQSLRLWGRCCEKALKKNYWYILGI